MDVEGVKEVIQAYFDSSYMADGEGMAEVFHDGSHLYFHGEGGALTDWDKDFFVELVGSKEPGTSESGFPRYDEILSIDFTGEDTAVARVKIRVSDTLYTDILCFMRLNGKWGVMSKVFTGVPVD